MTTDDPGRIRVRVYGDLQFFVAAAEQSVAIGHARSVKDLLESLGVPHPEIDVVVVDGEVVGFDHLVRAGDQVAAYPPLTSLDVPSPVRPRPPEPRFVLDVHLGTLARRLRLLGLDTDYHTDRDDVALATIAVEEGRILVSRDRRLLMRGEVVHGYCPRSDDPDEQMVEVVRRFVTDDDLAPLTRCPVCNGQLRPVAEHEVADQLGPHTRATRDRFRRCERCGQVFWRGSHLEQLEPLVARARAAARQGR